MASIQSPHCPITPLKKALENTLQKSKIPNSIGSLNSRINSSPLLKNKIQNWQLVPVRPHFLSHFYPVCGIIATELRVHLLFLGLVFRNMFMILRLLYFEVCGYELYLGH